jgi:hypothetical protein
MWELLREIYHPLLGYPLEAGTQVTDKFHALFRTCRNGAGALRLTVSPYGNLKDFGVGGREAIKPWTLLEPDQQEGFLTLVFERDRYYSAREIRSTGDIERLVCELEFGLSVNQPEATGKQRIRDLTPLRVIQISPLGWSLGTQEELKVFLDAQLSVKKFAKLGRLVFIPALQWLSLFRLLTAHGREKAQAIALNSDNRSLKAFGEPSSWSTKWCKPVNGHVRRMDELFEGFIYPQSWLNKCVQRRR